MRSSIITEEQHKAEYLAALKAIGQDTYPSWEELTEEQRENVRKENNRFSEYMKAFGEAIARGDDMNYPLYE